MIYREIFNELIKHASKAGNCNYRNEELVNYLYGEVLSFNLSAIYFYL